MNKRIQFSLSDNIYKSSIDKLNGLTGKLSIIAKKAGTGNPKFEKAWNQLMQVLRSNQFQHYQVENRFDLRALSIALNAKKELRQNIKITPQLLDLIDQRFNKPSTLFTQALFQYFLSDFDCISHADELGNWLLKARGKLKIAHQFDKYLLRESGPKTLAMNAIEEGIDFEQQTVRAGLDSYTLGDYIKRASQIYYVEQLKIIPANQPHPLLVEISKDNVANSRYDENALIGHIALKTLIARAPALDVHETWQNTILAIAGDPRVPPSNPRYIKWWSQIPKELIRKVQGWLSKLDLKLFLEALEDYSRVSQDEDMMRMFPSRKSFLEGMHKAGSILHTKLYLSTKAVRYIKRNYQDEHVPDYSIVKEGDKSIIYVELTSGHMIEGSHNCQIWFYRHLPENCFVRQYGKQVKTYRSLTKGFDEEMTHKGCRALDHFQHLPSNFSWQRRSIDTLKRMGVRIRASDVLSLEDYNKYKRIHGVD